MIILGDVNLCTTKWKNEDFTDETVANILINTLTQQGLEVRDVGPTYYSDHIQSILAPKVALVGKNLLAEAPANRYDYTFPLNYV